MQGTHSGQVIKMLPNDKRFAAIIRESYSSRLHYAPRRHPGKNNIVSVDAGNITLYAKVKFNAVIENSVCIALEIQNV